MRLADPQVLWLLLFVPLMALYLFYFREGDIPTFRFSSTNKLPPNHSGAKKGTGFFWLGGLRITAILFLIMALARPQKGLRSEEMTTKAADIMICLDASRSMLTVDFQPDDRFTVAKQVITDFIKGRQYDRLGMVLFAEYAVTQCPLTTDKNALQSVVENLKVGSISPDQTAIGVGLATSVNRLKNSKARSKVIILLTDGANNAGSVDPITAAKTAASFGIKIYSIGAGTPEGGMMPIDDPRMGRRMVPVRSDLDEDMLLKVATETQGKYFRAKSEGSLKTIFKEIDLLEKTDIKIKEYVDYKEFYVWFLLIAVFLLSVELILAKTTYRTLP